MGGLRRIRDSHELSEVGVAGAGDETLGTIDDIIIPLPHSAGFHRSGIRTGIRLGLHEAELFLAPHDRVHKTLLLIVVQRVQDRPNLRPEDSLAARRQRDGAGKLLPNQDLREATESAAAVLFRNVKHPETHLFGFFLQALANVWLQFHVLDRVHLDRNQFFLDELPHRILQHLQFFGQIEIHSLTPVTSEQLSVPVISEQLMVTGDQASDY